MYLYNDLKREFELKGIPVDQTDFYDHPNFLKSEQVDPSYLIKFAKFVAAQPYTDDYLNQAEKIIRDVVAILSTELIINGREGACIDISVILTRMLERKGIWCVCIKGSTTIEFPKNTGIDNIYYWSSSLDNISAGHAWVYAPPFSIIDISLNQQPHSENEKAFIPKIILVKDALKTTSNLEDIISPEVRSYMQLQGIPQSLMLDIKASELKIVQASFPAQLVIINETKFKYSPVAVHASLEALPDIRNMKFDGEYPYQMYKKKIEKQVGDIG